MKNHALHYAGLGLAVFPIKPRSKQPLTTHGFKDASKDQQQIEQWWTQWPDANIGIATGGVSGGLVVIDLDIDDNKGVDGRVTLREWEAHHGGLPVDTWMAITGRGGYHYFYHDTATVRNRTGIYKGIDVRGEGGYIVAPPSIHPNGNTYTWEHDPVLFPLAEANGIIFDFLCPSDGNQEIMSFALPDKIMDGERTSAMVKLVCSQQAKGLSDEAIRAAVRAENEQKCNPPLMDRELEKEVFPAISRYQKGTAHYQEKDYSRRSNWNAQPPKVKPGPVKLVSMDQVEEKEPEWLINDYIPRGQITVLAGDGGAGKTTIWCAIAAAVSSGSKCFLNQDNPFAGNCKPGKVLFFSSEDTAEYTLVSRLRKNGAKLENVLSLSLADDAFSEIKFDSERLEEIIKEYRPELVLFDPLQSFIPPNIQMGQRNAMRACLNPLIGLGEQYGVTFIIVVHTNKQSGMWGRKRIADSADIWDIARSVLIAGEANDGLRYISQEKSNYGPLAQTILFKLDSGKVEFEGRTDKKDKDFVSAASAATYQAPAREDAKAFILDYLKDGEKETSDLDEMMKAQGVSGKTLERAKAELKKDGIIKHFSRGYGKEKKFYCKLISLIPSETLAE
jgi:hypothetical protein